MTPGLLGILAAASGGGGGGGGGDTGGSAHLTRTTPGLIVRDLFPGVALSGDWTVHAGAWTVAGGKLTFTATGITSHASVEYAAMAAVDEAVIEAIVDRNAAMDIYPAVVGKGDWAGAPNGYIQAITQGGVGNNSFVIQRLVADANVALTGQWGGTIGVTGIGLKFWTKDNQQRGWRNNADVGTETDGVYLAVGKGGVWLVEFGSTAGQQIHYADLRIYRGNALSVSGLPAGWKAVVGSKTATEVAGTATVDLVELSCPQATLVITDGADVPQDTFTGDVYGGDGYVYA